MSDVAASQAVRNLMNAMETASLTLQEVAEAFAALTDEQIEELGRLVRERQGRPLIPRRVH